MRLIRHPLVAWDLDALVDHITEATRGDVAAAIRRLDEVDALLRSICENPNSGVRLSGTLESWLVRHGGRDQRLSIVFRSVDTQNALYIAIVAFGGQDWMNAAARRREFD